MSTRTNPQRSNHRTDRTRHALSSTVCWPRPTRPSTLGSRSSSSATGEVPADALVRQLAVGRVINDREAESIVADVRAGRPPHRRRCDHAHRPRSRPDTTASAQARPTSPSRLYADLPEADLVTARRLLDTLTERARAQLVATA